MKISLEWLSDYVELPKNLHVSQLMHDLTMATVEVEGAEIFGPGLQKIVSAEIVSIEPIEGKTNAKLTSCVAGKTRYQVICGADNIEVGMKVALALPGAKIRPYGEQDEKTIEVVTVGDIESQAVICAASEIGLEALFPTSSKRSVIDLGALQPEPGEELAKILGWNDTVLEIDNKSLTNRPDLWGHYGIARELSAIYNTPLKPLTQGKVRQSVPLGSESRTMVGILDEKNCRRFAAVSISGVDSSPAPLWMKSRLARIGQRTINFYADLTNYVMFAIGQPCHAYDAKRVALPLSVRLGKAGEKVTLLDNSTHEFDSGVLAIADKNGAIAAAGVMGGADSEISEATTDVILEMANFDPVTVRRGAKKLGIRTDASSRFEKSIDTQRIDAGLDLFLDLVTQIQPNTNLLSLEDVHVKDTSSEEISVDLDFLLDRLGKEISVSEIETRLRSIGFEVRTEAHGNTQRFIVLPPSWRSTGDVSQRFDMIEEVARLHGYDEFHFSSLPIQLDGRPKNPPLSLERKIREILAFSCGMNEVISYPWVKDKFLEAAGFSSTNCLKIAGAPAPDQACLQPSLLPNLLESILVNLRYFSTFKIFEVGTVFPKIVYETKTDPREALPLQEKHIGGAFVGTEADVLFREARGAIERLARTAHLESLELVSEVKTLEPWADRSGVLEIRANGQAVGQLAVLSNRVKRLAGIRRGTVVYWELNLDLLKGLPSRDNRYQSVPEYPVVDIDLSLVFGNDTSWERIKTVAIGSHSLIDEVLFVDQYRGQDIPQGKKSVTLRLRLLSRERTLKSEEANEVGSLVSKKLMDECQAQVRTS